MFKVRHTILIKNGFGYISGDFRTNSSGHPAHLAPSPGDGPELQNWNQNFFFVLLLLFSLARHTYLTTHVHTYICGHEIIVAKNAFLF
jgi:hypothetical protein